MMDRSLVNALICSPKLTSEAVRGLALLVAETAPERLLDLAQRDDLDEQARAELLRAARPWEVIDLLDCWPAEIGLVDLAVSAHGPSAELVVFCGAEGWLSRAVELGAALSPEDTTRVPRRWEERVEGAIPDELRRALINAAISPRTPIPGFSSMSDREQREVMERRGAEEKAENQRLWALLEPAPQLWATLARDGEHQKTVRRVLLRFPAELSDDVLLACLPSVTSDALRPAAPEERDYWDGQIRLSIAARHVRRQPRLREVAARELQRVVREAVEDGWTPHERNSGSGTDWKGIADLAVLTEDATLLADAAAAARTIPDPPSALQYRRADDPDRFAERTDAVLALAANDATPGPALVALVPTLDENTLAALADHRRGDLADASRVEIDRRRQAAEARQPRLREVPGDDELTQVADPVAVLSEHLRYLRGPAAQRDRTSEGLLRSRHTTPEILRALPARHVLNCAERAEEIAAIIIETCGGDLTRWQALAAASDARPPFSLTFGAWLSQLTTT
ncbi:hypothetical protein [Frankia tisae]|uniref:hypothetical protein n=1 Tax=Frankia tisae TaxID=2950104 RepID=UPI0021C0C003|nr:hypothetical protein [Frankia tisae]